ncbi:MAG: elongation factor Ts [Desulfobulbaceae bacterium]|nr:elongation factor Ts [Desulfobulbaceae bacterium]
MLIFLILFNPLFVQAATATYELEFTSTWNNNDITINLPVNAHFTILIGVTHGKGDALWIPGTKASQGVENVAETGSIGAIQSEISQAISAGTAGSQVISNDLYRPFPSSSSTVFQVTDKHSSISLISMIAPSPDWFVGVSGLSLKDSNGNWIRKLIVNLVPWDAGTENGSSFSLSNTATSPQRNIALINGNPFVGTTSLGTLEFNLQSVSSASPGAVFLLLSGL